MQLDLRRTAAFGQLVLEDGDAEEEFGDLEGILEYLTVGIVDAGAIVM